MGKQGSKSISVLLICMAAMLWGFDGVVLTPRLHNLDVKLVVFLVHALPFILFSIFSFKEYKLLMKFSLADILSLTLVALLGGAIGTLAIVKALFLVNFQQLTVVVLIQKLQPVFAIALAAILLKEKLLPSFYLWGSIAIAGAYFLAFGPHLPDFNSGTNTLEAALYALLASFSFGAATVFSKKILRKYNFRTVTFYRYGITSLIMLLIVSFSGRMSMLETVTQTNWLIITIIALTTGSGAILIYNKGLKNVKASVATICELCYPVSAVVFDYIFNKSMISTSQWISAIAMITAIFFLNRTRIPKVNPGSPILKTSPLKLYRPTLKNRR